MAVFEYVGFLIGGFVQRLKLCCVRFDGKGIYNGCLIFKQGVRGVVDEVDVQQVRMSGG